MTYLEVLPFLIAIVIGSVFLTSIRVASNRAARKPVLSETVSSLRSVRTAGDLPLRGGPYFVNDQGRVAVFHDGVWVLWSTSRFEANRVLNAIWPDCPADQREALIDNIAQAWPS